MNEFIKSNRELWNELTDINFESEMYDVDAFLKGDNSLYSIEIEEVGDVQGKSMLHLQCHFGMDTLSWEKMGAIVTGVDFSEKAIEKAEHLRSRLGLKARFICSEISNLRNRLKEAFDIVFTCVGALCWLPDLKSWAKTIAAFLKPGGFFYIWEFHPFITVFKNERDTAGLEATYSYFPNAQPHKFEADLAYADWTKQTHHPSYEWTHSLSEIFTALLEAGLRITQFNEFPFCSYDCFPFMEEDDKGWWRMKNQPEIPLMFSLKAVKD